MGLLGLVGRVTRRVIEIAMRLLIRLVIRLIPWVVRLVGATIRVVALMLAALFRGVPTTCQTLAAHWTERACAAIGNSLWSKYIYYVMYFIAILTMVAAWILLAWITVIATQFLISVIWKSGTS